LGSQPRLITVYFDPGKDGRADFNRLLNAYRASAGTHGVTVEVVECPRVALSGNVRWAEDNTVKLRVWQQIVEQATGPTIITDADMLMLNGDLASAFYEPFDVGFTWRSRPEGAKLPINGGVFFFRPSEQTTAFMRQWVEVNERMYVDKPFHLTWKKKYQGINQSALGYMLETGGHGCKIARMPCATWNALDEDWPRVQHPGEARFLHIKGILRKACLKPPGQRRFLSHPKKLPMESRHCVGIWDHFDAMVRAK